MDLSSLLREIMESNSIPMPSNSDPAPVNTLGTRADPPAVEPETRPSAAGPTVPGSPTTGATNPPGSMEQETIQPKNDDEPNGAAASPTLSSSPPQFKPKNNKRVRTGFTSDDDSSSSESDSFRNRYGRDVEYSAQYQLLPTVDDDPEENTKAAHGRDPDWRWPAYDKVSDGSRNFKFAKRGKARKVVTKGFPFQVIYRNTREIVLWPDAVIINLKSAHLLTILSQYLPNERDLQYMKTREVDGRKVYILLEKLKHTQLSSNADGKLSAISVGLIPAEQGSVSQHEQNGASHGVFNGKANLATEISEIHTQDPVSRLEEKNQGAGKTVNEKKNQGAGTTVKEEKNQGAGKTVKEARRHLHHLVRFLEEDYAVVALREQHMKEDKSVSFDMLWAFLTPGTTVVYYCDYTQEQVCGKVSDNKYCETRLGDMFTVTLDVWDYNGAAYRKCATARGIGKFSGEKPFDTLGVFPIDKHRTTSTETLKDEFLAKGRKFQELAMRGSNCFQHYNGAHLRLRRDKIVKEKADGRVMVDLTSFATMNPDYSMTTAQPPVSAASKDDSFSVTVHSSDKSDEGEDENLIFAPAIVYGFSFTIKQWGVFSVMGFSKIDFDTNAFDALVMEPDLKELLYNLVSQFIAIRTPTSGASSSVADLPRVDPIANKGEGCIFLCYGPPGTGKTLTAESLAENLHRPLWSLSVAELGTTPGDLEKTLLKVLEIAALWKAVLLLDEADVYLEKRVASTDLTRNAMTGVFLRLLEYYRGVLFLTTNRITTFDDAFRSRISLVVCYPKLDQERREQIWRMALARVQAGKGEEVKVGPEFLADMAQHGINGREIRNVIHIAQTLARRKNEELQDRHLRLVMSVVTQTSETLDAALLDI